MRGAWIEIFIPEDITQEPAMSPPTRGAWIEIRKFTGAVGAGPVSPPTRGAWIEIQIIGGARAGIARRPLRGGRGLK